MSKGKQGAFEFEEQLLASEITAWGTSESDKGQIYTRPEVVEFMLTLLGLNTTHDFDSVRILEPSCGEGEFVVAIVDRLLTLPRIRPTVKQLINKLLAIDLVAGSLDIAKKKVAGLLESRGYRLSSCRFGRRFYAYCWESSLRACREYSQKASLRI
jgi:hypothetical protein